MMRSESTSALGQPRLTKPILGATGLGGAAVIGALIGLLAPSPPRISPPPLRGRAGGGGRIQRLVSPHHVPLDSPPSARQVARVLPRKGGAIKKLSTKLLA